MDKAAFFAHLRQRDSGLFGTSLSQGQVDGTEALLDEMTDFSVPHAAHVLAEVYHETGGGMLPVKETVFPYSKNKNPSDRQVINRLERAWAQGKLGNVSTPYWRDGWFGRGQIQITHEYNYHKAAALTGEDLVQFPQKALRLPVSAAIASYGCLTGMFTGKLLSDFDGARYDHYNARAIVNGDKRKNGNKIAAYGLAFERALRAAGWGKTPAQPADVRPHPWPLDADDGVPLHGDKTDRPAPPAANWLEKRIQIIMAIFGGRK